MTQAYRVLKWHVVVTTLSNLIAIKHHQVLLLITQVPQFRSEADIYPSMSTNTHSSSADGANTGAEVRDEAKGVNVSPSYTVERLAMLTNDRTNLKTFARE